MTSRQSLVALALAASSSAHAFSCAPTDAQECRLELDKLTVVFDAGVYNFDGDSQLNGTDGYVTGFTVGAGQFPELTAVDTSGGLRAGFSFDPGMYGRVGGSGFGGNHEAFASFVFSNLQFIAKPGFKVDAVEFAVAGGYTQVGNGYVWLLVPGTPQYSGDEFVSKALYAPNTAQYVATFSANASYEEGEDGTANSYGTASAWFSSASLIAHVSAVPGPASWLLSLAGLGALALAMRRRGTAVRPD